MPPYDEADPEAVRKELHADGWDTTGLDDDFLWNRIEERARPLVENELMDGNPEWVLPQLEALLAAHFVLASGADELRQAEETTDADGATRRFTGEYGRGFESTSVGQQAVDLDQSGTLAQMSNQGPSTTVRSVGRLRDE